MLDEAAKNLDSRPEYSLKIIKQINVNSIRRSPELYAKYCLIYSQALDKNYIDVTNDIIIKNAVDFYKNNNDKIHLMQSYYYLSRVQQNAQRFGESIISCFMAQSIASKLKNYHYLGLIYREMADLYNISYNSDEELIYRNLSLKSFKLGNDSSYMNDAVLDLCEAYNNAHKYNISKILSKQLMIEVLHNKDSITYYNAARVQAEALIGLGKIEMAKNILLSIGKVNYSNSNEEDSVHIAFCFYNLHKQDSALIYEQTTNGKTYQNDNVWFINYKIFKSTGRYAKALVLSEKFMGYQDSILKRVISHSVQNRLSDYVIYQKKRGKEKAEKKQFYILIISVTIIVVLILIALVLYYRWRNKFLKIERDMLMFQNLKPTLESQEKQLAYMTNSINNLFRQQFETIDSLCNIYYEGQSSVHVKNRIYDEVLRIIKSFQDDKKIRTEFKDIVNHYKNNIMMKLDESFPELKDIDCLLFLYVASGFSSRSISVFLQENINVIYNRKSRLKNKISKSDSKYREELLAVFYY